MWIDFSGNKDKELNSNEKIEKIIDLLDVKNGGKGVKGDWYI